MKTDDKGKCAVHRGKQGTVLLSSLLALGITPIIFAAANPRVVTTIRVGSLPNGVVVDSTIHRAYIANAGSNNVSVIDTDNNTVVATVRVGAYPLGVAVNPDTHRVYVANSSSRSVSVIDTRSNTVLRPHRPVGPVEQAPDDPTPAAGHQSVAQGRGHGRIGPDSHRAGHPARRSRVAVARLHRPARTRNGGQRGLPAHPQGERKNGRSLATGGHSLRR